MQLYTHGALAAPLLQLLACKCALSCHLAVRLQPAPACHIHKATCEDTSSYYMHVQVLVTQLNRHLLAPLVVKLQSCHMARYDMSQHKPCP